MGGIQNCAFAPHPYTDTPRLAMNSDLADFGAKHLKA